jgi:hypothetical protein
MNEKLEQKRKRGRPVEHPRIVNLELRKTYHTYTEAAEDIKGSRFGVRKVCEGTQRHHHGYHFRWIPDFGTTEWIKEHRK